MFRFLLPLILSVISAQQPTWQQGKRCQLVKEGAVLRTVCAVPGK